MLSSSRRFVAAVLLPLAFAPAGFAQWDMLGIFGGGYQTRPALPPKPPTFKSSLETLARRNKNPADNRGLLVRAARVAKTAEEKAQVAHQAALMWTNLAEPELAAEAYAETRRLLGAPQANNSGSHLQLEIARAKMLEWIPAPEKALASLEAAQKLLGAKITDAQRRDLAKRRWTIKSIHGLHGAEAEAATIRKLDPGGAVAAALAAESSPQTPCLIERLPGSGQIYVDLQGEPLTQHYSYLNPFAGGGAVYNSGRARGLMDDHLRIVTGPIYQHVRRVAGVPGRWLVAKHPKLDDRIKGNPSKLTSDTKQQRWNLIDQTGRRLMKSWVKQLRDDGERLVARNGEEKLFFTYDGEPTTAPVYPPAGPHFLHKDTPGFVRKWIKGGEELRDKDGKVVLGGKDWDISAGAEGLVVAKKFEQRERKNSGKVIQPEISASGVFDIKTRQWTIPLERKLQYVGSFQQGYAQARDKDGKTGLLRKDGTWSIPPAKRSISWLIGEPLAGVILTSEVPIDPSKGLFPGSKPRADGREKRSVLTDLDGKPRSSFPWAHLSQLSDDFFQGRPSRSVLEPRSLGIYPSLLRNIIARPDGTPLVAPGRLRLLGVPVSLYVPEKWSTRSYTRGKWSATLDPPRRKNSLVSDYSTGSSLEIMVRARSPKDSYEALTASTKASLAKATKDGVVTRLPDKKAHGRTSTTFQLVSRSASLAAYRQTIYHPKWIVDATWKTVLLPPKMPGAPAQLPRFRKRVKELHEDLAFRGEAAY